MLGRCSVVLGLIALLLPLQASAAGKCDEGGVHAAEAAAAREAVRARCDCEGASSHAAYVGCAWEVAKELAADGQLPRMCRGRVRQFASRSTCGRDDVVACCLKTPRGPWRPAIRRAADGCVPRRDGSSCEANFPHLEYACLPDSACRVNRCGDGILDPVNGEGCEPPGVGLCDAWCQTIVCGNGTIDPGEDCEPPDTPSCNHYCVTKHCGDGIVNPADEECEPPGTPTCNDLCYFNHECGNGVVDLYTEDCEPPGTATCDATCRFIHTCGDGVVEVGEECDGQPGCTSDCRLTRSLCCGLGDFCLAGSASDEFDAYFNFFKPCVQILGGSGGYGTCEGTEPCPPPAPPEIGCFVGSCGDSPIEPLELCCQEPDGTCRDTLATTAGAIGAFGCGVFPPPEQGDVPRLTIGTCGGDGRCVPGG